MSTSRWFVSYLRATGREHGLILNFAKPTLEIKRVIASQRPHHKFLVFLASLAAPLPWAAVGLSPRTARPGNDDRGAGDVVGGQRGQGLVGLLEGKCAHLGA